MHPLIKSIIIGLETDRGDLHQLKFTDFYFRPHPKKEYPEYQDTITFKIDPGYSNRPEAILKFTGVILEYEEVLIPRRSTRVERMLELLLERSDPSLISKEVVETEDSPDPEEWYTLFDKFKKSWQEPNLPTMRIGVGGFIGKLAEAMLASLVLAASVPGIIQFIFRFFMVKPQTPNPIIPIQFEIISYVPMLAILGILAIRFFINQRKSKKKKV